jgi:hypothetical protein
MDEKKIEFLQIIQDFTDKLTLQRILTAIFAGAAALMMFTMYEHRAELLKTTLVWIMPQETLTPSNWDVSESTKKDVTGLMNKQTLIKLTMVEELDLQKNRRIPKFLLLNTKDNDAVHQKLDSLLPQPIFNSDSKNTQQMVQILNNDFVCAPTKDTMFGGQFPELESGIPYICAMAIPPFYGRIVGILVFGVSHEPTNDEQASVRIEASRMAIQIYMTDVMSNKNK